MIGIGEQKEYFERSVYFFCCIFNLSRESDQWAMGARLGVAGHLYTTPKWGIPLSAFPNCTTSKLAGLFSTCPFNAERPAEKLWIPILKSLVWPDSELSPSVLLPRRTLLPTPPSELLAIRIIFAALACYRDEQTTGPAAATSCLLIHYAVFF